MEARIYITGDRPICKICSRPMEEWIFFSEKQEHIECAAERIAKNMVEDMKVESENLRTGMREETNRLAVSESDAVKLEGREFGYPHYRVIRAWKEE